MDRTIHLVLEIFLNVLGGAVILFGLYLWLKKSDDPARLAFKLVLTALIWPIAFLSVAWLGPLGLLILVACCIALALIWGRNIGEWMASSITSSLDGGATEVEAHPVYSIAESRRKLGKYSEAIEEIEKQLQHFPTDFAGQLMLAEIKAENLHDNPAAQAVIQTILTQPGHAPRNLAYALNRSADWHLKIAHDPGSARASLEQVCLILADTEQARLAEQRIAHLPTVFASKESGPHTIALKKSSEKLGLVKDYTPWKPVEESPVESAEHLVARLEQFPNDYEAREELARLYAEHLGRFDWAVEQLELLLAIPHQPASRVIQWLNLIADWHIKIHRDFEAARATLTRIVTAYPKTAAAETARNRIAHLGVELRGQNEGHTIKLGSYDQNIGLQKDWRPDQQRPPEEPPPPSV